MSGRIKLLDTNGTIINSNNSPVIEYNYDIPSEFDKECGTYGLELYKLPNLSCPNEFICLDNDVSDELKLYSSCIDATNCQMMSGMTTGFNSGNEIVLFIHQMIPHHQNAVNMAKALLHTNKLQCNDLTNDEYDNTDCIMERLLRGIISTQNYQIQKMRSYLKENNYPEYDDCEVYLQPK